MLTRQSLYEFVMCLRHRRKAPVAGAFWSMERGRWGQVLGGLVGHEKVRECYQMLRGSLWKVLSKPMKRGLSI